jgi:hypothetical protein
MYLSAGFEDVVSVSSLGLQLNDVNAFDIGCLQLFITYGSWSDP